MHDPEKSDSGIVAMKPMNKAGRPAAELAEPRPRTKGNADQQSSSLALVAVVGHPVKDRSRSHSTATPSRRWRRTAAISDGGDLIRTEVQRGSAPKTILRYFPRHRLAMPDAD
jgi:hypothetical protein